MSAIKIIEIILAIIAWVNFCKTKSQMGIFNLFNIVRDCKIVDMPPKLIIKEQATIDHTLVIEEEISIQPLVISINPSKTLDIGRGKRLNMGDNEVITTKKMAIITPTEITLKAESNTMLERSPFCWLPSCEFFLLSSFIFSFL